MVKKIASWIDINFEPIIMCVLFYVIVGLLTLNVILRFVFSLSLAWAEELSRFVFVWLMFFAISYATRNQRHIRVSFFVQSFGEKIHKAFLILSDLIFIVFITLVFLSAIKVCQSVAKFQDMAVTMEVSLNVVYGAGVVGLGLILLRLFQSIIWKLKNLKSSMEVFENQAGVYTGADDICFFSDSYRKKKSEEIN